MRRLPYEPKERPQKARVMAMRCILGYCLIFKVMSFIASFLHSWWKLIGELLYGFELFKNGGPAKPALRVV
jgi:hypothetical protein